MTSAVNEVVGHKRKSIPTTSASRKRQKIHGIREISVQSSDAAISTTGELDVASFVKAREYEISALEKSMQKTKKALTMRAFQQVPRAMRRRTASHNVKKVPRRLRRRAEREVSDRKGYGMEPHLVVIVADEGILAR
jgi:ribonuclease P/MRP protein subunit POP1